MYHTIYKTTHIHTGEYYIGKHSTANLDDGYSGSGKWVRSLPKGVIDTEILHVYDTEEEALTQERRIVDDHLCDPLCRNLTRGGRGSFYHLKGRQRTEDERKALSRVLKDHYSSLSEEEKEERRQKQRGPCPAKGHPGERNPFFGKRHSEHTLSLLRKVFSTEERANRAVGNTNVRGRKWFNNGVKSFMLPEEKGNQLGLSLGRIKWKQ